jgi:1,4-alpha-glucan branching enzyme
VSAPDAARLVHRDHHDPHAFLGAHPHPGGVVVRAFRPGAERVWVRPAGRERAELAVLDPGGVFEGVVGGADLPMRYEIEATYADGAVHTVADPYAFPPTLGEFDLYLLGEGRHEELHHVMGAHVRDMDGVQGTAFAVWAPSARSVSVVGDFNHWDGRLHPMRSMGASGVWELFVPGVGDGDAYKYEIRTQDGAILLKADPLAQCAETPPKTASVVFTSRHEWRDHAWTGHLRDGVAHRGPMSVYEVHLPSWRLNPLEGNRPLTYAELGQELGDYAREMGFTHVELLPVMEHPFGGSWGYQVTSYFAPTSRMGSPDDLRAMVDALHGRGIGVILDWAPAHFPKDDWALARFDGTALYEHLDPRRGEHPDWGTLVFNYSRTEVRNFLIASALYWLEEFHIDGLRVDAVASMLYLDYSRREGEWVPNPYGGREDLDAIAFIRQLNESTHARRPGTVTAAEESTAWPAVSRPTSWGGLGFDFKWNMGWMHDTLSYFARDPVHRIHHHNELTFSLLYAFTENFMLPLSHDEVVHGKGSLVGRMPGDQPTRQANLRALYAYMWAHPGKKLLFMGSELAQEAEWSHERSLDWHLLEHPGHAGVQRLVREMNHAYRAEPALWEVDHDPAGFEWLEPDDAAANVLAFMRFSGGRERSLVCVANLSGAHRQGYRVGLPHGGRWRTVLDTDRHRYGGGTPDEAPQVVDAEPVEWHRQAHSAPLDLAPLSVRWLVPDR